MPSTARTPTRRQGLAHLAERRMEDRERGALGRERSRARDGVRVAIEGDHPACRGVEHGAAVAAATEGRVDIDAAVLQPQGVQSLIEKNGPMGHSAFPQARYQQAAAGVRTEFRRAPPRLAFLPNSHRRHCLVSFHRASRHESSTARFNTVDTRPTLGTTPPGQKRIMRLLPVAALHTCVSHCGMSRGHRPSAKHCCFTVTRKGKLSPVQAAARYRQPPERSRDFRALLAKHMQSKVKRDSRTVLWISAARPETTSRRVRYHPSFCSCYVLRVTMTVEGCRRPVSRVLSPARKPGDGHSSGTRVAAGLARPTRTTGPETGLRPTPSRASAPSPLLGLAPGGVCRAADVAAGAVRPYRTLSPLPAGRPKPAPAGGLLSVALSLGSPPPGVTRHRVSVEPGLSSPASRAGAAIRPPAADSLGSPRARRLASAATASARPMVSASSTPSQHAGRQRRWNARRAAASGTPCASPG